MNQDEAPEGLWGLIHAVCENAATPDQVRRLERWVLDNPAACQLYLDYIALHGSLCWSGRGRSGSEEAFGESTAAEAGSPPAGPSGGLSSAPIAATPANRSRLFGFLADAVRIVPGGEFVVGGLVLLAVTGAVWGVIYFTRTNHRAGERQTLASGSARATPPSVGSLATDDRARWAQKSLAPTDATVRLGRRYELAAGWAKIELTRGTTVAIEGPAAWQLSSDQRLQLESGRLVAYVPKAAVGFTVVTPSAEAVDLGTEFGVEVDGHGATDLHVIRGRVELKPTATAASPAARKQQVVAGQAVRVLPGGETASPIPLDRNRFEVARGVAARSVPAAAPSQELWPDDQPIWLGNLFDDAGFIGATLVAAVKSDEFRAKAEGSSLGVDRVVYAGSPVRQIAPGVIFDATNLGWQDAHYSKVTNDAWHSGEMYSDENGARGGIRTQGKPMGLNEPRIEEGIGMHASALITFDLDAIRLAGGLAGRALEFRCDRAGVNDASIREPNGGPATIHMAALVSGAEGVRQAVVDGRSMQIANRDGVWRVKQAIGEPLRADGRFVEYRVLLPADAKWLTLLAASAGDGFVGDHAVWSGARLEVAR